MATLSWLLITAAVAGLAALAVVVVQGQVESTAERISSREARVAAAALTAFEIEDDARDAVAEDFETWAGWEAHFGQECSLITVLYADIDIEAVPSFVRADGGTDFDAAAAGYAAAGDEQAATASKAQIQCLVQ